MVLKKLKDLTNSGFGSDIKNEGSRLITKKGRFNTKKEGLSFLERFDLFHWLVNMPTAGFYLFLFASFAFINILFSLLYVAIGVDQLQGISGDHPFLDAFYFSIQTITTVGYGGIHPTGKLISLVAGFEAFIGLLGFAIATGLLYGRFAKPKNNMLFSEHALISPYREITGLMARVANPKNSQLINAEAKMMYSQIEIEDDIPRRRFYTLDLEISFISLFAGSWTVVHPINEDSPIYGVSLNDLKERNAELLLLINAFDETYNQPIHVRTSYKPAEMVENAKFIPILGSNENGQATIQLDQISKFEMIKSM